MKIAHNKPDKNFSLIFIPNITIYSQFFRYFIPNIKNDILVTNLVIESYSHLRIKLIDFIWLNVKFLLLSRHQFLEILFVGNLRADVLKELFT